MVAKQKEAPLKGIIIREPTPGSSKSGARVVYGFADDVEANVFAKHVEKKANVLLNGDRDFRQGDPLVTEVLTVAEELERRGFKPEDWRKAVQLRRDDIADRERINAEEAERKVREAAEAERQRAIAAKAEELAQQERDTARQRLEERAAALVDEGKAE